MYPLTDLTGRTFGKLTVLRRAPNAGRDNRVAWFCRCACGNMVAIRASSLKRGDSKSCGCGSHRHVTVHGMSGTRLYGRWENMKRRCLDPRRAGYRNYGGRGIRVCPEWMEFAPFRAWATANGYRDDLSIERIDNDGNYEPSNCRWATRKEQNNNRKNSRLLAYRGRTQTLSQWAAELGIPYGTLSVRLNRLGWSVEQALAVGT